MKTLLVRLLLLGAVALVLHVPEAQDDPVVLEPAPCYAIDPLEPTDPTGTLDGGGLSCSRRPKNC